MPETTWPSGQAIIFDETTFSINVYLHSHLIYSADETSIYFFSNSHRSSNHTFPYYYIIAPRSVCFYLVAIVMLMCGAPVVTFLPAWLP